MPLKYHGLKHEIDAMIRLHHCAHGRETDMKTASTYQHSYGDGVERAPERQSHTAAHVAYVLLQTMSESGK